MKTIIVGILLWATCLFSHPIKPLFVWKGPPENKVALTFDDGPKPDVTPRLLQLLKKNDAKATFFIVGRDCLLHPDLIEQIDRGGHECANHSFTHLRLDTLTTSQIQLEIQSTNDIIKNLLGKKMTYFRPPGGRYNQAVTDIIQHNQMTYVMWTVNAGDYHFAMDSGARRPEEVIQKNADKIAKRLLNQIKQGSIVLLHNTGDETYIVASRLIEGLKKRGYQLVTLTELLKNAPK